MSNHQPYIERRWRQRELKYDLLLDAVSFSLSVDEIMIIFFIRIVILFF